MKRLVEAIVRMLEDRGETISFMESCTGGYLASHITNVSGSSNVLKVSLVTYSNEYKVKFGVDKVMMEEAGVYSNFTSNEMALKVSEFAKSNWGVGITGQLGIEPSMVYYTIYRDEGNNVEFFDYCILAEGKTREEKKEYIANRLFMNLLEHIVGE